MTILNSAITEDDDFFISFTSNNQREVTGFAKGGTGYFPFHGFLLTSKLLEQLSL